MAKATKEYTGQLAAKDKEMKEALETLTVKSESRLKADEDRLAKATKEHTDQLAVATKEHTDQLAVKDKEMKEALATQETKHEQLDALHQELSLARSFVLSSGCVLHIVVLCFALVSTGPLSRLTVSYIQEEARAICAAKGGHVACVVHSWVESDLPRCFLLNITQRLN